MHCLLLQNGILMCFSGVIAFFTVHARLMRVNGLVDVPLIRPSLIIRFCWKRILVHGYIFDICVYRISDTSSRVRYSF